MKSLMSLNRFEAFSDGVFAIAMTLLVIEIKLPDLSHAAPSEVVSEMMHIAPHLLSYITGCVAKTGGSLVKVAKVLTVSRPTHLVHEPQVPIQMASFPIRHHPVVRPVVLALSPELSPR